MGLLERLIARLTPPVPAANAAPYADVRRMPIGMYAGNPPLPQDPDVTRRDELLDSMLGEPGLRLALSSDQSSVYYGTDAIPAPRFPLTGPVKVNRDFQLEVAGLQASPNRAPDLVPPAI